MITTATVFDEQVWEPVGIPVAPYSLKNRRQWKPIWKNKVKIMTLSPSDEAQKFLDDASLMWKALRPDTPFGKQDKLELEYVIRYSNYMQDFVGAQDAIADALAKSGVIPNDRAIRSLGPNCHVMDEVGEPMTWVRLTRTGSLPWEVQ
jgi:hypothetical protein